MTQRAPSASHQKQSHDSTESSWTCANDVFPFLISSPLSSDKTKSFKSEKGHAGHTWRYRSHASACFACCHPHLPPFPSSCATVYDPAPDSSMYPLHCHLLPPICFFIFYCRPSEYLPYTHAFCGCLYVDAGLCNPAPPLKQTSCSLTCWWNTWPN